MDIIWFGITLIISFFVGVFGFAQIVGSLQTKQKGFLFTLLLWAVILIGVYFCLRHFLPEQIWGCYIGYGISLITILSNGKIQ